MNKKASISRRLFMSRLATGTFSLAMIPSFLRCQNKEGTEQSADSLPKFFDCSKYVGPGFPENPDFPGVTDLIAHMDRLGIDRAVAWHTDARQISPMAGNERLLSEIDSAKAGDRIIPSLIIAPSIINDPKSMDRLLEIIKTRNVRAFHFFPKEFSWSLSDISPVIQKIRNFKPVLFLKSGEAGADDILNFTNQFPEVSVVITNAWHPYYSMIFKLLEQRSNIFVDTSLLHSYRIIEDIIGKFGEKPLIFGTGYKSNNGASLASLVHSEVSPDQMQQIAHGNLEQLLGIKTPLKGYNTIVGDRFWHRLLRKEPIGPEILDVHTHHCRAVKKWDTYCKDDYTDFDGIVAHNLRSMDKLGVKTMYIAEASFYPPDTNEGKTYMEEHMSPYGDRFRGYLCASAFMDEYKDKMIPRLDEIFSRPYYIGFKMHNDHWGIPITDPCFIPMWEYADNHHLSILLHTWSTKNSSPKLLTDIAPRYPNAFFLLGHSGNTDRPDAEQLALDNPNVYLEWCGSFVNPADWCETIKRIGNDRIVYGSDGISGEEKWLHNPVWEIGRLLSLDVSDETLLPILGDNMRSILAQRKI